MQKKRKATANAGTDLEALVLPLAKALHGIRTTIANWDDAAIWQALDLLRKSEPVNPGDPDLCEAECRIFNALELANLERIARNAPWLAVDVICANGRWRLTASHDHGDVLRHEFATFEEAKAAGDVLHGFLGLLGRGHEFTYQQPRRDDRADAKVVPYGEFRRPAPRQQKQITPEFGDIDDEIPF